jgi:hypothetical protein
VVYDKYKTALVSDPRHPIAPVDFLQPASPRPAVAGFQGLRKSTRAIRWLGSDTRADYLLYFVFFQPSIVIGGIDHLVSKVESAGKHL